MSPRPIRAKWTATATIRRTRTEAFASGSKASRDDDKQRQGYGEECGNLDARGRPTERDDKEGSEEVDCRADKPGAGPLASKIREDVHGRDQDSADGEDPERPRHAASLNGRNGQSGEADEFALRDEDDAGHGKQHDQRNRQESVDCARGQPVLRQEDGDEGVHARAGPAVIAIRR
jgi:hypothetical protein